MKRHRGLKRYYRNLSIQNDFDKMTWLDFEKPYTWFDNWHIHFDWHGYGNDSFRRRKPHLDKLFRHFDLLVDSTKTLKTDFQLYTILLDFDSYSDALFLHTPNPNNTQFPFSIENFCGYLNDSASNQHRQICRFDNLDKMQLWLLSILIRNRFEVRYCSYSNRCIEFDKLLG